MPNAANENPVDSFRAILEKAKDAIVVADGEGRITFWNEAAECAFGYSSPEVLGQPLTLLMPARFHDAHRRGLKRFLKKGERRAIGTTIELAGLRKDGTEFPLELSLSVCADAPRGDFLFAGILRDITDRKRTEDALRRSEERYRQLIDGMGEGVCIVDESGRYTFVNRRFEEMLGYAPGELLGVRVFDLLDEPRRGQAGPFLQRCQPGVTQSGELRVKRKDGSDLWVLFSSTPLGASGVLSIVRDNSDRKRLEQKLRDLSLRDDLTHLYNRRAFHELAAQQLRVANRTKRPLTLFYADINGMKTINDGEGGHAAGDEAIRVAAAILRSTFRESDVAARMGGDEFAILALDCGNDAAIGAIRRRFQDKLAAFNARPGQAFRLSVSMGATLYDPARPRSLAELLAEADREMYERKRLRRSHGSSARLAVAPAVRPDGDE